MADADDEFVPGERERAQGIDLIEEDSQPFAFMTGGIGKGDLDDGFEKSLEGRKTASVFPEGECLFALSEAVGEGGKQAEIPLLRGEVETEGGEIELSRSQMGTGASKQAQSKKFIAYLRDYSTTHSSTFKFDQLETFAKSLLINFLIRNRGYSTD